MRPLPECGFEDYSGVMRRFLFLVPALLVIALDQWTKQWCRVHLPLDVARPWIGHWVYLTLTYNARGAFSLFPLPNAFFIGLIVVLLTGFSIYALRVPQKAGTQILLGLILGGGIGNLIDRIRLGAVVDFIDLRWWPVFNVADSAVSVGITCFVLWLLFGNKAEGKSPPARKS